MSITSFSFPTPIKVGLGITSTLGSHGVKDSGMARLPEIATAEAKVNESSPLKFSYGVRASNCPKTWHGCQT